MQGRLRALFSAVNRSNDLTWPQWEALYDFTMRYQPKQVVELGRGYGNSTCVFTEASQSLGCEVVSVGYDSERAFERVTWPRVQKKVSGPQWRRNLIVIEADILQTDFEKILGEPKKTLLFWDAHGAELAQFIYSKIFPLLEQRENQVVVHDIGPFTPRNKYKAGDLGSDFEELTPLMDYLSMRHVEYALNPTGWLQFSL